jgi:O-antigen/teichoic acid export membrane protein
MFQAAIRYRRFPLIAVAGNLLNSLNLNLPLLITTAFYGTQISGILMLSQTVLGIPSLFLANAISQAYFGESAKILKNNPNYQMSLFWRIFWRLLIVGAPVFLAISFLSPWLFRIFGKGWNDSAVFVQYLTPMFIIQFIGSPLSAILDVLERQDLYVVGEVSRIITLGIAAYLGKTLYGSEPTFWILSYSILASVAYIISISLSWYAIRATHRE